MIRKILAVTTIALAFLVTGPLVNRAAAEEPATAEEDFRANVIEYMTKVMNFGTNGNRVTDRVEQVRWVDALTRHGLELEYFMVLKEDQEGFEFLDWRDNGCSFPGKEIFGGWEPVAEFVEACMRHDFCYRNNDSSELNRPEKKGHCDELLGIDLTRVCAQQAPRSIQSCRNKARLAYNGAKEIGEIK